MKDNPFRYRGYYYDTSIGLYYLNSRYYDPETGRFLNEDLVSYLEPETIGGINLYAYCLNDPVNNIDPSGHFVILALILAATTAIGMTVGGVVAHEQGKTGWSLIGSILLGGALGFAAGGLAIAATGAVFGAIHGMNAFLWGMKASEVFALGAAAYDIIAATVGPIAGLSMTMIEWGNEPYKPDDPRERYRHPANQRFNKRAQNKPNALKLWSNRNDRILWRIL